MKYSKYILVGLSLLFSRIVYAQKKIPPTVNAPTIKTVVKPPVKLPTGLHLLAKHKNNSIVLRWAPLNPNLWMLGNQFGYTLEKTVVRRNGKVLSKPESSIQIKLLPASKEAWIKLAEKEKLLILNILLAKELLNNSEALKKIELSENRIKNVLKETAQLSNFL